MQNWLNEGLDVSTSDSTVAFIQTDYNKGDIHIKMEGKTVTLIEDINPDYYKDFIYIYIRWKKCIYAETKKDIYVTIEASLLFWTKLSKIPE